MHVCICLCLSVLKSHLKRAWIGRLKQLYRLCERRFVRTYEFRHHQSVADALNSRGHGRLIGDSNPSQYTLRQHVPHSGILFISRILCSQHFKRILSYCVPPSAFCSSLKSTVPCFRRVGGQFFFSWEFICLIFCQLREMFPSTCGFSQQFYNSHPDLRHPIESLHSQHQPSHLIKIDLFNSAGTSDWFGAGRRGSATAEHSCDLSTLWLCSFAFEAVPECGGVPGSQLD